MRNQLGRTYRYVVGWLIFAAAITGCITKSEKPEPSFKNPYAELTLYEEDEDEHENTDERLTFSMSNVPLIQALRYLSNESGYSIICHIDLDEKPVSVDVLKETTPEILSAIARRLGVDLVRNGTLFFLGKAADEDRGFLVRKVRRLKKDQINEAVTAVLSDIGRSASYADGLLIVSDKIKVLQQLHSLLDQIENAPSNTWLVQIWLVSSSSGKNRKVGVHTKAPIEIARTFARTSARLIDNAKIQTNTNGITTVDINDSTTDTLEQSVTDSLNAAFKFTTENSVSNTKSNIIAEPLFLILDGESATFQDGSNIPIPKKTVSDSGTVTTTGYETIETGLDIQLTLREYSRETAGIMLEISLTSISGYVDEAPITVGQSFKTSLVCASSGIYLAGSLSQKRSSKNKTGTFFPTHSAKEKSDSNIEVWLKAYRIKGVVQK